jgi:hypothetical protein
MQKHYKSFKQVQKESDFESAVNYKILELRDKSPLINKIMSLGIINHVDSTSYHNSYIAHWDSKGKLDNFNPNPDYTLDMTYLKDFDFYAKV